MNTNDTRALPALSADPEGLPRPVPLDRAAAQAMYEETNRTWFCPKAMGGCGRPAEITAGEQVAPYARHQRDVSQTERGCVLSRDSRSHLVIQHTLVKWAEDQGYAADLEEVIEAEGLFGKRRVDVVIWGGDLGDRRVSVEVQLSRDEVSVEERTEQYKSRGMEDVQWLHRHRAEFPTPVLTDDDKVLLTPPGDDEEAVPLDEWELLPFLVGRGEFVVNRERWARRDDAAVDWRADSRRRAFAAKKEAERLRWDHEDAQRQAEEVGRRARKAAREYEEVQEEARRAESEFELTDEVQREFARTHRLIPVQTGQEWEAEYGRTITWGEWGTTLRANQESFRRHCEKDILGVTASDLPRVLHLPTLMAAYVFGLPVSMPMILAQVTDDPEETETVLGWLEERGMLWRSEDRVGCTERGQAVWYYVEREGDVPEPYREAWREFRRSYFNDPRAGTTL